MADTVMSVRNLQGWYGESHVLHNMSFDVAAGEVATLLGRNGAGKTTTMRAIMGVLDKREGSIVYRGDQLIALSSDRIARRGLAYCPEERGIFASLNVGENLLLPPTIQPGGLSLEDIYALFPGLRERLTSQGSKLSGGEQQMLAIARLLRTGSRLLLLDEPTEGLAPIIVRQIGAVIAQLRDRGFTILLVEQNFHFAASVADRHYVVEGGRVIDLVSRDQIGTASERLKSYLGL